MTQMIIVQPYLLESRKCDV